MCFKKFLAKTKIAIFLLCFAYKSDSYTSINYGRVQTRILYTWINFLSLPPSPLPAPKEQNTFHGMCKLECEAYFLLTELSARFIFPFLSLYVDEKERKDERCKNSSWKEQSCDLDYVSRLRTRAKSCNDNVTYEEFFAVRSVRTCWTVTDERAWRMSERVHARVISSKRRFLPFAGCTIVRSSENDASSRRKSYREREQQGERRENRRETEDDVASADQMVSS